MRRPFRSILGRRGRRLLGGRCWHPPRAMGRAPLARAASRAVAALAQRWRRRPLTLAALGFELRPGTRRLGAARSSRLSLALHVEARWRSAGSPAAIVVRPAHPPAVAAGRVPARGPFAPAGRPEGTSAGGPARTGRHLPPLDGVTARARGSATSTPAGRLATSPATSVGTSWTAAAAALPGRHRPAPREALARATEAGGAGDPAGLERRGARRVKYAVPSALQPRPAPVPPAARHDGHGALGVAARPVRPGAARTSVTSLSTVVTASAHRAFAPRLARPATMTRRAERRELRPSALAFEVARREAAPAPAPAHRGAAEATPARRARPAPARAPELNLAEIEHAITTRLERRLDQKISATIRATLGGDAEVSRAMTERVYDTLYDRMVLEKERRG